MLTFSVNGGEVVGDLRKNGTDENLKYIDDIEPENLYIDITDENNKRIMIVVYLREDNSDLKGKEAKENLYGIEILNLPKRLDGANAIKYMGIESNINLDQSVEKKDIFETFHKIMKNKSLVV